MEMFLTIQGEGYHAGRAAYFIRLEGCDVGCVWCDVKESWEVSGKRNVLVDELVERAHDSGAGFVVITGGEPLMHNLDVLCNRLKQKGIEVAVETSGTSMISGNWHWICFSPKKFKAPLDVYYDQADELKVVVFNKHDLKWAETHAERVGTSCKLYLQPEWDKRDEMLPLIIEYIKDNPKWKVSLQTHKYLDIP